MVKPALDLAKQLLGEVQPPIPVAIVVCIAESSAVRQAGNVRMVDMESSGTRKCLGGMELSGMVMGLGNCH